MGAAVGAAEEAQGELRPEGELLTAADLEAVGDGRGGSLLPGDGGLHRLRFAVGRGGGEALAVEGDPDVADVEGDVVQGGGDRVRDGGHLGALGDRR